MDSDLGLGETPYVRTRRVIAIAAGILALLVLIAFGFQALFPHRIGQTYTVEHGFPAPAVITNERAQRLALEAKQKHDLDGADGRMPIAAAMKAIAAKGAHAFDPIDGAPP
jgi:hypothetical protein